MSHKILVSDPDNINIEAATLKGILVINAPDGNTISATEHSVAMLLNGTKYSSSTPIFT